MYRDAIRWLCLNNPATTGTIRLRVYFGGSVMWNDLSVTLTDDAGKRPIRIDLRLFNKNSTSAQGLSGIVTLDHQPEQRQEMAI